MFNSKRVERARSHNIKFRSYTLKTYFLKSEMYISISSRHQLSASGVWIDWLESNFTNHSDSKFIVKNLIPFLIQGLRTWEKLWMTQTKTQNLTIRRQTPPFLYAREANDNLLFSSQWFKPIRRLCQSDKNPFHLEQYSQTNTLTGIVDDIRGGA